MPECRRHAVFQFNIIYSARKGQDDFVKMYSRGEFCAAVAPFLWKLPSFRFFEKKLGKKLYWVPYTFRVSEGSAGPLCSKLSPGVCACGTVRCKLECSPGFRVRSVLKNAVKQGTVFGCAAEALPAAETAEAEQGPPSKFSSGLRPAQKIWVTATRSSASVFASPPPWCAEKPTKRKKNKRRERA